VEVRDEHLIGSRSLSAPRLGVGFAQGAKLRILEVRGEHLTCSRSLSSPLGEGFAVKAKLWIVEVRGEFLICTRTLFPSWSGLCSESTGMSRGGQG
jgi:hypothetical protein